MLGVVDLLVSNIDMGLISSVTTRVGDEAGLGFALFWTLVLGFDFVQALSLTSTDGK